MISRVTIVNYRTFRELSFTCNDTLNIIVGDNEAGKSTILEAINLVLTRRLHGRPVELELSHYLFNREAVAEYVSAVALGQNPDLPRIVVELCIKDDPNFAHLRGTNNLDNADCIGIGIEIAFDEDYRAEYERLLSQPTAIRTVPVEYYKVSWFSFAYGSLTTRGQPVRSSFVDPSTIRLQHGTDFYLQSIINEGLDVKDRVELALAYRRLKEHFSDEPALKEINAHLDTKRGELTSKALTFTIDVSQRGSWESSLTPHLDDIPYAHIGNGEQSALKIMLALDRKAEDAHVVLIEEPENHLSFSTMARLLDKISIHCEDKQLFITTHSAYVLNRLGMDQVMLLHNKRATFLTNLKPETRDYFRKRSGYDTLRMILAKRTVLVEGPSDELIVQKAYLQEHGRLPLADGIDVINVRGLSFARFLDIAAALGVQTAVITDNDGDFAKNILERYVSYAGHRHVRICADPRSDLPSLEDQFVACNSLSDLNAILGTTHESAADLVKYMKGRKTEWALAVFDSEKRVEIPAYIADAIA